MKLRLGSDGEYECWETDHGRLKTWGGTYRVLDSVVRFADFEKRDTEFGYVVSGDRLTLTARSIDGISALPHPMTITLQRE